MKTLIAIIIAVLLILGSILIIKNKNITPVNNKTEQAIQNVSVVEDKQIIDIRVKGGYSPKVTTAKADIPTIIRFNTNGTFDCSSYIRIPSLGINETLPNTGAKEVNIGTPNVGILSGSCGMGMYSFQIKFE